jgi:Tol biopolymer transport system component
VGDIASLLQVAWFPDGKHLLLEGAAEGQTARTYEMDTVGGKPEPVGPADFRGMAVSNDGKRIAGWNSSGQAVVFDGETQKMIVIPGIQPQELFDKWTEDGEALLVYSTTRWEAQAYRVEVATGKRTLLQTVELTEKAGSSSSLGMEYAERSKSYVYEVGRDLGTLYVVEGLE